MPPIRSLASKCCAYTVAVILLLNKIMLLCSRYVDKGLVYIIIIAFFSRQPSSYIKYTKLNMYLSCNVRSVFNTKYIFIFFCNIYSLFQLLGRNT